MTDTERIKRFDIVQSVAVYHGVDKDGIAWELTVTRRLAGAPEGTPPYVGVLRCRERTDVYDGTTLTADLEHKLLQQANTWLLERDAAWEGYDVMAELRRLGIDPDRGKKWRAAHGADGDTVRHF